MEKDPFKEYIKQSEPGKRERGYAWHTAIGLQAVDGLQPSGYLIKTAIQNIEGEITLDQVQKLLESYYEEHPLLEANDRTEEADKVSARIAGILSEQTFSLSMASYLSIHERLFEGIYSHAGKMRDYNITKKEWVLDGATVLYGSASELERTLEYDLSLEREFRYRGLSMPQIIKHLAFFVSRLWQIHVFAEGNTRTTAVFFIKYLRKLGFDVTNDIFAENAWYFRNALVRANYNDLKNGIHETTEFLEIFLKNLLLNEHNELHNRSMHISGLLKPDVEDKKPDIGDGKPDVRAEKPDIGDKKTDVRAEKPDIEENKPEIGIQNMHAELIKGGFSKKTICNVEMLFTAFGYEKAFGRGDIMKVIGIKDSAASELLKKMLAYGMLESVKGMGKGKYRFKK